MFYLNEKNLFFFDIAFIDYLLTDQSVKKIVHIFDLQTILNQERLDI